MSARPDIRLQIDRLVLDGIRIDPRRRRLVGTAMEAELARLLVEGGIGGGLGAGVSLPRLRLGTIAMTTSGDPVALGRQIAGAVYDGIGAGSGEPPGPTR